MSLYKKRIANLSTYTHALFKYMNFVYLFCSTYVHMQILLHLREIYDRLCIIYIIEYVYLPRTMYLFSLTFVCNFNKNKWNNKNKQKKRFYDLLQLLKSSEIFSKYLTNQFYHWHCYFIQKRERGINSSKKNCIVPLTTKQYRWYRNFVKNRKK